jgi:hypothetical protein
MARSFNGTSDYLLTGKNYAQQVGSNGFAACCRVRFNANNVRQDIFNMWATTAGSGSSLQWIITIISNGTNITIQGFIGNTASFLVNVDSLIIPVVGQWYDIILSFDGTTNGSGLVLYVNGVSTATNVNNSVGLNQNLFGVSFGMSLESGGGTPGNPADFFNGSMCDCAMWLFPNGTRMTMGEVAAFSNGYRPDEIRNSTLVGYWPMGQGESIGAALDYGPSRLSAFANGTSLVPDPPLLNRRRPKLRYVEWAYGQAIIVPPPSGLGIQGLASCEW